MMAQAVFTSARIPTHAPVTGATLATHDAAPPMLAFG